MISPKLPFAIRLGITAGLVGLVVLMLALPFYRQVEAGTGEMPAVQPALQSTEDGYYPPADETQSPEPTFDDSYPGYPEDTGTPGAEATQTTPEPGITRTLTSPTPSTTATVTPTSQDLFRTEDAEMNNAKATQAATQTPAPTMTRYTTQTAGPTRTARPTLVSKTKKSGWPPIDWGMFWIGVSLPVFAACGLVLYLLDRHPNFFKPTRQ